MKHSKHLIQPFQEALEGYKDTYMGARNLAPRSRVEYETDVIQFLLFLQDVGVKGFEKISPNHIRAYLSKLDKDRLEGVTRRKKLTIIRTFVGWLHD
jgi:site-specific recombinase XerD